MDAWHRFKTSEAVSLSRSIGGIAFCVAVARIGDIGLERTICIYIYIYNRATLAQNWSFLKPCGSFVWAQRLIRAAPQSNVSQTLATLALVASSAWLLHPVAKAHPPAGYRVSADLWELP